MFEFFRRSAPEQRVEPTVSNETTTVVDAQTRVPAVGRIKGRTGRGYRSYAAASSDRSTTGWGSTPLTADQVIDRNQRVLVARSRSEAQSNDYMKNFLRLCEQNVVGHTGFTLQAQARDADGALDTAANTVIEAWWRRWCRRENCDITGKRSFRAICKSVVRGAAKDGEFMIREIVGRNAGPFGYALQVIDTQRCPVDYNNDRMRSGNTVRQGIEFTREGRPVAYYFMTGDPGLSAYTHGNGNLERVPADQIIHGYLEEITGQRRGIPWAATSLWRLHMLNGFEKSSLTKARTSASIGGFIEWEAGEGPADSDDLDDEELYIEPEIGTFQELPSGARHKAFNSQINGDDIASFTKSMLRGAGAGMGVAYVSFANDLEGVNFSSIRQGVLDERDHWMDLQEWLIESLLDRVFVGALKRSLLLGLVTDGKLRLRPESFLKYSEVFWQARRWAWVDPTKDVKAAIDAKNNLLTAPSDIIRQRGQDPEAVWNKYAEDIKAMRAAGIDEQFIMAAVLGTAPAAPAPKPEVPSNEDD